MKYVNTISLPPEKENRAWLWGHVRKYHHIRRFVVSPGVAGWIKIEVFEK